LTTGTTSTTTSTSSSFPSVTCAASGSSSISCTYSCPNQLSQSNTGILAIDKVNQAVSLTTSQGTVPFTGLTSGTKYSVGLVCDPQTGNLFHTTSITI
jgi:hypothetical protein